MPQPPRRKPLGELGSVLNLLIESLNFRAGLAGGELASNVSSSGISFWALVGHRKGPVSDEGAVSLAALARAATPGRYISDAASLAESARLHTPYLRPS